MEWGPLTQILLTQDLCTRELWTQDLSTRNLLNHYSWIRTYGFKTYYLGNYDFGNFTLENFGLDTYGLGNDGVKSMNLRHTDKRPWIQDSVTMVLGKYGLRKHRIGNIDSLSNIFIIYLKIAFGQGNQPAHLGFRVLRNILILIKSILNWLYENQNIKRHT